MLMNELIEKAKQIDELEITKSNHNSTYWIDISGSEKVKNHLQNIILELEIEDYIRCKNSFVKKDDIYQILKAIKTAESYKGLWNQIRHNSIINTKYTKPYEDKIIIETVHITESTILKHMIYKMIQDEEAEIEIEPQDAFAIVVSSKRLTEFEKCKQYCREQHKINKINEIFNLY